MGRKPGLDVGTAFRRQFVVDIGVQLIFGNGNASVNHCRCLCLISIGKSFIDSSMGVCRSVAIPPIGGTSEKFVVIQTHTPSTLLPAACRFLNAYSKPLFSKPVFSELIISPAAAPDVRPPARL